MSVEIADRVCDFGLAVFAAECNAIYICSSPPRTYTEAVSTFGLGRKLGAVGTLFSYPLPATGGGRKVTTSPILDGVIFATGIATRWAAVDTVNARLLGFGTLSQLVSVRVDQKFRMSPLDIIMHGGLLPPNISDLGVAASLTTGAPVFGAPTASYALTVLIPAGVSAGDPVLGAGTFFRTNLLAKANLTIVDDPFLGSPSIKQTHRPTAAPLVIDGMVLPAPTIQQRNVLVKADLTVDGMVLPAPTFRQRSLFSGVSISAGDPVFGVPPLVMRRTLQQTNLSSGDPVIGSPIFQILIPENDALAPSALVGKNAVVDTWPALSQGTSYNNLINWPSVVNRPAFLSSGSVLSWIGPTSGGASTAADSNQSLSLGASGSIVLGTAGQVVSGLEISGTVTISANNVTLRRCRIRSNAASVITIGAGVTGTVIEDCLIDGIGTQSVQFGGTGITAPRGTFRRNNITNVANAFIINGNGPTSIIDNWVHDLASLGSPAYDCVQIDGGASNVTISHNSMINGYTQTSVVMINNLNGSVSNITVNNNRLIGGTIPLWIDALQTLPNAMTSIVITNNRFGAGPQGYTYFAGKQPDTFAGNVDDITDTAFFRPLMNEPTFNLVAPISAGALIGTMSLTNIPLPSNCRIRGNDPDGYFVMPGSNSGQIFAAKSIPIGSYNPVIEASSVEGYVAQYAHVVIAAGTGVPVVTPASFQIATNPGLDQFIGTIVATNSPSSYAIASGNSSGYFAIYSSGNLRTSASVTPVPNGTYALSITATNGSGTSNPAAVNVTVGAGAVNALTAASLITDGAFFGVPTTLPIQTITHGQQINATNTGRAGAALNAVANYSPTLTTISSNTVYNTTQTIRNTRFTGRVNVTGGNVTFEFCQFAYQPPGASGEGAALHQYDAGNDAGNVVCNWCDFDTGLRGTQGNFETCGFQAGARGDQVTSSGSYNLFRCRIEGFGNNIGLHKFLSSSMSYIRECHIANQTSGGGSHMDALEIYGSDNVTIERCRVMLIATAPQSCFNISSLGDANDPTTADPIIVKDCYINGGSSPILCRWYNSAIVTQIPFVQFINNYFGDGAYWGRECDFNTMNVTFDQSYQASNPQVIYWAQSNVWAPNGEGVTNPATAPSGDVPAGRPHIAGEFVDQRNFYNGESFTWNGQVLPLAGGSVPVITAANFTLSSGATLDMLIGTLTVSNLPLTALTITAGNPSGYFVAFASSRNIRVRDTGTPPPDGTYSLTVTATNSAGTSAPVTIGVTIGGAPNVVATSFTISRPLTTGQTVGTVQTTGGAATAFSITAGNASGFFAISNAGVVTVTSAGANSTSGIQVGTINLTVSASNTFGTGTSATVSVVTTAVSTGWPDATNTGVTPGTVLTNFSGRYVVTTPNAVIQNMRITGYVEIQADNVTFRNCKFIQGVFYLVWCQFATGSKFENCTFDGTGANGGMIGCNFPNNGWVRNCHFVNCVDDIHCGENLIVEDNFLHRHTPQGSSDPHYDGITCEAGGVNVTIRHNTVYIESDDTSCVGITNYAGTPHDVLVENNLLVMQTGNNTGFCFRCDGRNAGPAPYNITFRNNHLGVGNNVGQTTIIEVAVTQSGNVNDGNAILATLNLGNPTV